MEGPVGIEIVLGMVKGAFCLSKTVSSFLPPLEELLELLLELEEALLESSSGSTKVVLPLLQVLGSF